MKKEPSQDEQAADSSEGALSNEQLDAVSGGLRHSGAGTEHDVEEKATPVYTAPGNRMGNSYPSGSGGTKA